MSRILMLRHAPTAWNEQRRIQGRGDLGLSARGRREAAARRVPAPWRAARWFASPLRRAVETAQLMGAAELEVEPRLAEMDWGEWEGCTLAELRARDAAAMRRNEARGLDFRPAGGESPREVRARLASWLAGLDTGAGAVVAVTHKGVIRCALSLADDWDMRADYPTRMDWSCGHVFAIEGPSSRLAIESLNVPLPGGDGVTRA